MFRNAVCTFQILQNVILFIGRAPHNPDSYRDGSGFTALSLRYAARIPPAIPHAIALIYQQRIFKEHFP